MLRIIDLEIICLGMCNAIWQCIMSVDRTGKTGSGYGFWKQSSTLGSEQHIGIVLYIVM